MAVPIRTVTERFLNIDDEQRGSRRKHEILLSVLPRIVRTALRNNARRRPKADKKRHAIEREPPLAFWESGAISGFVLFCPKNVRWMPFRLCQSRSLFLQTGQSNRTVASQQPRRGALRLKRTVEQNRPLW